MTTNPLWVALAVFLLYGERPTRYTMVGLAAALTGSLLIAFSDGGVLVYESTASPATELAKFNRPGG